MSRATLRRTLASLALLLCGGAFAGPCPEVDSAAVLWLDKMARSMREISYHGVVTLQREDEMQVMQVSHLTDGDASIERLTQLTGQGAEVDRQAHSRACVHPGHQLLRMSEELRAGRCGITERYRLSMGGRERVAGRSAVQILVKPLDMYRFGYVMSLDHETGLLLKSVTVGHGNSVLEKYQFASLSYDPRLPETMESATVHHAMHPHPALVQTGPTVKRPWQVQWLPGGFAATDAPPANGARRTYTDGLAVFSVFLETLERGIQPGEGYVSEGGTLSYTRGMSVGGQSVLVTVIGEVPVNTARMVADSIAWMH